MLVIMASHVVDPLAWRLWFVMDHGACGVGVTQRGSFLGWRTPPLPLTLPLCTLPPGLGGLWEVSRWISDGS